MCEKVFEQAKQAQDSATKIILEAQKMKEVVAKQNGKEIEPEYEMAMIPFAAYEMQQDRFASEREKIFQLHENEKDKIRAHYKRTVMWMSIAFASFVICVFAALGYLVYNYEFTTYSQDGNGINNYLSQNAQQGDVTYGAADKDNKA